MPIRFRCAYCNQLLGIAHRKAGSVVRCPTCAGQVVVPNVETETAQQDSDSENGLVFERPDFELPRPAETTEAVATRKKEAVLQEGEMTVALPAPPGSLPGAWGTHADDPDKQNRSAGSVSTTVRDTAMNAAGFWVSRRRFRIFIAAL